MSFTVRHRPVVAGAAQAATLALVPLAAQLQQEKVDSAVNRDQLLPRKPLPRPQGAGRGTR